MQITLREVIERALPRSLRSNSAGLFAKHSFSEQNITDDWFRSHYSYAADIVASWLGEVIDLKKSSVVDFGCGDGIMDLGLALKHRPRSITGIDIHDAYKYLPETAKTQLGLQSLPPNLGFVTVEPGQALRSVPSVKQVDAIFSWSVFEHVEKPLLPGIFADLYAALPPGGVFFLQIEPLYYSPFGSHLSGLISEPWAHLRLSHDELVKQIEDKQPEQVGEEHKNKTFELCSFQDFKDYLKREYLSLNRVTAGELLSFATTAGFAVEKKRLNMVDLVPSADLLRAHSEDDLRCSEIMLLLRRPHRPEKSGRPA